MALTDAFAALDEWNVERLDATVRAYAESVGLKLGKIAQPLRAALTGRTISPGIFEVMVLIGREESLARLADVTHASAQA
jgi:glutamyl-tRNA synthetase